MSASASTASVDDGEVADDAQLDALEKLAFEECKIPHDYAGRWLFTKFGTRNPANLTKKQAECAMRLLRAHRVDGTSAEYKAAELAEINAGTCK